MALIDRYWQSILVIVVTQRHRENGLLTVAKKMETCTFNHNSVRMVNNTDYRALKRSSLVGRKLLHTLSMLA